MDAALRDDFVRLNRRTKSRIRALDKFNRTFIVPIIITEPNGGEYFFNLIQYYSVHRTSFILSLQPRVFELIFVQLLTISY